MLTTDFVTGAPNWLDLGTPDTDAAAAFYNGVFGWDFQSAGPDAGGYGFLQKNGRTLAGLGPNTGNLASMDDDDQVGWGLDQVTVDGLLGGGRRAGGGAYDAGGGAVGAGGEG